VKYILCLAFFVLFGCCQGVDRKVAANDRDEIIRLGSNIDSVKSLVSRDGNGVLGVYVLEETDEFVKYKVLMAGSADYYITAKNNVIVSVWKKY